MSGVEVAGLVLAALPLFISAAEHYRDGLGSIHKFFRKERILELYIDELNLQDSYLRLHLQSLLGNTQLPAEIQEKLGNDPAGPEWQSAVVKRELEDNLGLAYESFVKILERITKVLVGQIKKDDSLHSGTDSQIQKLRRLYLDNSLARKEGNPGKLELWSRVKFSWKEPDRNQTLLDLKTCNDDLLKLNQAVRSAAGFQKKQQGRRAHAAYQIREEAQKLFHVLSTSCKCNHKVPSKANLRMRRFTDDTDEAEVVCFDLLLFKSSAATCQVSARMARKIQLESLAQKSEVRFQTEDCEKSPSVSTESKLRKNLEDICAAIHSAHQGKAQLEIFVDREQKVWEMGSNPLKAVRTPPFQFLSLEDLLSLSTPFSEKRWLHREKAILAIVLAYSLLQLHQSPWLSYEWSAKHIYFLETPSFSISRLSPTSQFELRTPYVSTFLDSNAVSSPTPAIPTTRVAHSAPRNSCLIALGVILLELYLNRPIQEDNKDGNGAISHEIRYMAIDLLEENADNITMTVEYYRAIQFCLFPTPDPHSRQVSLDDAGFRELYYKEVIVPLEENLSSRFEITDKIWAEA